MGYYVGRPKITCCNGCTERQADPNCHGFCEKYLSQKAELEKKNAEVRKKQEINWGIMDQKYDMYAKIDRAKHTRRK
jgi:hypothetical protein